MIWYAALFVLSEAVAWAASRAYVAWRRVETGRYAPIRDNDGDVIGGVRL